MSEDQFSRSDMKSRVSGGESWCGRNQLRKRALIVSNLFNLATALKDVFRASPWRWVTPGMHLSHADWIRFSSSSPVLERVARSSARIHHRREGSVISLFCEIVGLLQSKAFHPMSVCLGDVVLRLKNGFNSCGGLYFPSLANIFKEVFWLPLVLGRYSSIPSRQADDTTIFKDSLVVERRYEISSQVPSSLVFSLSSCSITRDFLYDLGPSPMDALLPMSVVREIWFPA